MKKYTNKELIFDAFAGKRIQTIPKFMLGAEYIAAHSGVDMQEYQTNIETYVKTNIEFEKKYGTAINVAGSIIDVVSQLGGGLVNKEGNISKNGEETILTKDDISKLHEYSVENSSSLKVIEERIAKFKELDPDTPTMVTVHNTAMVVSGLIGATAYYKALLRNKEFVKALSEAVEPMGFKALEYVAKAGCDIIWIPMPTMGGTCISKKMYTENCHEYSKRFVDKVHELGMKAIIHTCGNWNDRFDVVMQEGADALHLSEAILPEFAEKYGKDVCMIGNISVVDTLMYKTEEEVYQECYQSCLDACKYGNFIIAPDCGTPVMIEEGKIDAMYRAADDAAKELFKEGNL